MVERNLEELVRPERPISHGLIAAALRGVGSGFKFILHSDQQGEVAVPKGFNNEVQGVVAPMPIGFGFAVNGGSFGHSVLRRLVGTADGRAKASAGEVKSPRALAFNAPFNPKERQALMARLITALARLDDHWIGDLIGAVCLFGMLWGGLFLGFAAGLK